MLPVRNANIANLHVSTVQKFGALDFLEASEPAVQSCIGIAVSSTLALWRQESQGTSIVALRRVRTTIVVVGKHYILHIASVCL